MPWWTRLQPRVHVMHTLAGFGARELLYDFRVAEQQPVLTVFNTRKGVACIWDTVSGHLIVHLMHGWDTLRAVAFSANQRHTIRTSNPTIYAGRQPASPNHTRRRAVASSALTH